MNDWSSLFSLNIGFTDTLSYRRVYLISSTSIITTAVFFLFVFINTFLVQQYTIAILDFIAAFIFIANLLYLKKTHCISHAAKIATVNLIFFFLSFIYTNGSNHFALIWTIFLPIFAIFVNGRRVGLYFALTFYLLLFSLAYINIGIWENGSWGKLEFMRLFAASTVLVFVLYMNEKAQEESDKQLASIRKKEKEYMKKLHAKSITDELTQLYNRRYFYDMAPKLAALAKRKNHYITFFILDIDYFKYYNDYYGHLKGDDVLIRVSQAIKNHIQRDDDFVFRLGGEEFAGIIISEDTQKTNEWIKKLCDIIRDMKIEHSESLVSEYITVSIGIATINPEEKYDLEWLYNCADQALYDAKNNGRNRCELNFQCL